MALHAFLSKVVLLAFAVSLAACQTATGPSYPFAVDSDLQRCIDSARQFRRDVAANDANNAAVVPLESLPFLATNRFHAALADTAETSDQIDEWVQLAATIGAEFREFENQTLANPWPTNKMAQLNSCSQLFAASALYEEHRAKTMSSDIAVKDNYSALPQWLGFYPLLRPIFKSRINKLHLEEKRWFSEEEIFSSPLVYGLANQSIETPYGLEEWFIQAYQASPLSLPKLSDSQLAMLFELHAPQYEIDVQAELDKLGSPNIMSGSAVVDTSAPIAYTLPSYTRFNNTNLLQLNYVVWFPARGPVSLIDLFAGKIDSLIWRVTLDASGHVLFYDSVHSCGCYHKYFLASDNVAIRESAQSQEPANIFRLTDLDNSQGLRLVVSSNEHYLVDIEPLGSEIDVDYTMTDYSALYTLAKRSGSGSLFGPTGIIQGSERLERFTLWPTGIESVGAMRQWGTHATGFVDQQHFDDATLFDKYLIVD